MDKLLDEKNKTTLAAFKHLYNAMEFVGGYPPVAATPEFKEAAKLWEMIKGITSTVKKEKFEFYNAAIVAGFAIFHEELASLMRKPEYQQKPKNLFDETGTVMLYVTPLLHASLMFGEAISALTEYTSTHREDDGKEH